MKQLGILLIFLFTALTYSRLEATPVFFFNDQAGFDASAPGLTQIDFEGILPGISSSSFFPSPPGLTISGVNFQSTSNRLFVFSGTVFGQLNGNGDLLADDKSSPTNLVATLPSGTTAVSSLVSFRITPGLMTVTLSSSESLTFNVPAILSTNFFGVTSDTDITSIRFQNTGGVAGGTLIDNFRFGAAAPVPEPSTMLLLLSGLAGLGFFRWRRKREA